MDDLVFSTEDVVKRKIDLKTDTWVNKIANISGENYDCTHGNSHPEMVELLDKIQQTVEQPDYILRDTKEIDVDGVPTLVERSNREEYIGTYVSSVYNKLQCIKVVVEFDGEDSQSSSHGEIVTSHKYSRISQISTVGGVLYNIHSQK